MRTRVTKTEVPFFTTVTKGVSPLWFECDFMDWVYSSITETSYWTLPTQSHHIYSENSSITDETTPKYLDIESQGSSLQVPAFKDVRNTKFYQSFEPSSSMTLTNCVDSTYSCRNDGTVNHVDMCWKIITSGAPTDDWDRNQLDSIVSFLVNRGVIPSESSLIDYMSTNASSILKGVLSETDSLLGFQESFNILNFIAELKDVRKLPELLTKWTKSTHDVSDKFLGVEFGVLPFKGDILAILNRLRNTGPYIDKWNDMAKNAVVSNVHRNVTQLVTGLETDNTDNSPTKGYATFEGTFKTDPGQGTNFLYGSTAQARSSSTIRYKLLFKITAHVYYIPVQIPDELIGDIKRSLWGLDKPLEAAWNALPFSFVVDWFVNLGDLIADFERSEPLLTLKVVNAGYSISYKLEVYDTVQTSFGSYGTAPAGNFTTYYDGFTRKKISPSSILVANKHYGPLRFTSINQDQALLGSALLHQLLR